MDEEYDYALEYFYDQARNTGYAIANMYKNTVKLIEKRINDYIVDNIAKNFYSQKAERCLKSFAYNVKIQSDDVAQVFINLRNQLQSIVNNYEWERSSDRHLTVAYIQYKPILIDITNVKAVDDLGNRYIKKDLALDVEDWVHQCKSEIKAGVKSLSFNVPTDLYIGGGQSYALRYALNQISGLIDNIFSFLTYGENSIYNAIYDHEQDFKRINDDNIESWNDFAATSGGLNDGE